MTPRDRAMEVVTHLCRTNDLSIWRAATGLADLVSKKLIAPVADTAEVAEAAFREIAEAHRPGRG